MPPKEKGKNRKTGIEISAGIGYSISRFHITGGETFPGKPADVRGSTHGKYGDEREPTAWATNY